MPGLITGSLEGDAALILLVVGIGAGVAGLRRRFSQHGKMTALGLSIACSLAGLALLVDAMTTTTSNHRALPLDTASAARGQPLYQEYCTACHGVAGKGDGPAGTTLATRPPDLTTYVPTQDGQTLHALIRDGQGDMPAFGDRLSDADIDAVIAYLRRVADPKGFGRTEGSPNPLGLMCDCRTKMDVL